MSFKKRVFSKELSSQDFFKETVLSNSIENLFFILYIRSRTTNNYPLDISKQTYMKYCFFLRKVGSYGYGGKYGVQKDRVDKVCASGYQTDS